MHNLLEKEYLSKAKSALLKVFRDEYPDPFSDPFLPSIDQKLVIDGGIPSDDVLKAIERAALDLGDTGFYLHSLRRNPAKHIDFNYEWYVSFDDLNSFKQSALVHTIEYAYYSPQGLWGMAMSDIHGVLGGPRHFCDTICKMVPSIMKDVLLFISYWQKTKAANPERIDLAWLEPMLASLYGEAKVEHLFQNANQL